MNLKALRTKLNLTQKQLAVKMDTSQQTVARWETEKTPLNAEHIRQLCGILHCTTEELLGWDIDGDEGDFDDSFVLEYGLPYGTLKLGMIFGEKEFAIGGGARENVMAFLDRHSVLNRKRVNAEWLVFPDLGKRLLIVNLAAMRTVNIISDEIEAMPAYENNDHAESLLFVDADADDGGFEGDLEDNLLDPQAAVRVTFMDGGEISYQLTQGVADAIYEVLVAGEVPSGSMLMVASSEAGHLRSYVNLSEVGMIDLPAHLFSALTRDDEEGIGA